MAYAFIALFCLVAPALVITQIYNLINPGVLIMANGEYTDLGASVAVCIMVAFIIIPIIIKAIIDKKNEPNKLKQLELANEQTKLWIEQNKIINYNEKVLILDEREKEINAKESQQKKLEDELKNAKKELENVYNTKTWKLGVQQEERQKMTANLKKFILERDDYTCQCCGASLHDDFNLKLEVDHIVPISKGGKTDPSNLQTLCQKCNRSKGAKSMKDFEKNKKTA